MRERAYKRDNHQARNHRHGKDQTRTVLSRTLHRLCVLFFAHTVSICHALPSLRIVRFTLGFGTAASGAADRPTDGAQRYVGAGRGEQLFGTRTRREGGRTLGSAESLHSSRTVFPMGVSVWVGGYGLVAPCGPCVTTEMCPTPGGPGGVGSLSFPQDQSQPAESCLRSVGHYTVPVPEHGCP